MHVNAFDRYHAGASPIHRLSPQVKVLGAVLFILSNLLLPDGAWTAFLASFLLIVGISIAAGLGAGYPVKRSFIALPFALAAFTAVFALPGRPVAQFQIGPWDLIATDAGLLRFASVVVRSWLSVQGAILLVATTQFPDLMHALRHLHVPGLLIAIISFMYRYLFVLSDEVLRLLRAREARSASLPGKKAGGSLAWRGKVAGNMAGQLFLNSYERSERVYQAMLARGYQGQLLTLNPHALRRRDWALGALLLALLALIQLIGRI